MHSKWRKEHFNCRLPKYSALCVCTQKGCQVGFIIRQINHHNHMHSSLSVSRLCWKHCGFGFYPCTLWMSVIPPCASEILELRTSPEPQHFTPGQNNFLLLISVHAYSLSSSIWSVLCIFSSSILLVMHAEVRNGSLDTERWMHWQDIGKSFLYKMMHSKHAFCFCNNTWMWSCECDRVNVMIWMWSSLFAVKDHWKRTHKEVCREVSMYVTWCSVLRSQEYIFEESTWQVFVGKDARK